MAAPPGLTVTGPHQVLRAAVSVFRRLLLLSVLLLASVPAAAETLRGIVVHVADGDTITALDSARMQHKVRLSGIDAPEKHQAFGSRSTQHLAALVKDKPVIVTWKKRDRYGRIVGQVFIPKCANSACPGTLDAGLAQLHAGLAWHYKQYQREQEAGDRERYAAAEHGARIKQEGLWQYASPVPPWDYRRRSRTAAAMISRAALPEQPALFEVAPAFMRQRIAQLRAV